jgi:hypothetical protein
MLPKELRVLYSYDNKSYVHAKHIVIKIKAYIVKGEYPRSNNKSWVNKNLQIC